MKYKLSICIPTLNRGSFIGETIKNISLQLNEMVEVIIVDGGSVDNTEQVVTSYQRKFKNIHYFKKDTLDKKPSNEGFDRDCNQAIELARGDYCWLMTDDDLLMPNAIKKILLELEKKYALIVAATEVRNNDFTKLLIRNRPNFNQDRIYKASEWDNFFARLGSHLTFLGAVIIKRKLWLSRNKVKYFGSGFVHIGVIFDEPIIENILVTSRPLVSIRFGNAQWTNRAFQIWMINWPNLIWSFSSVSDKAKLAICRREPWRGLFALLFNRALGIYSTKDYELFIANSISSIPNKFISRLIAVMPRFILFLPVWLYILIAMPDSSYVLFNLKQSWMKK